MFGDASLSCVSRSLQEHSLVRRFSGQGGVGADRQTVLLVMVIISSLAAQSLSSPACDLWILRVTRSIISGLPGFVSSM